jgi:hypothetical protein
MSDVKSNSANQQTNIEKSKDHSSKRHALAGSLASAIGTICLHPLDNVKVRLQGLFVIFSHTR